MGALTTNFAIACKASGEAPLNVQWYHDGSPVKPDSFHALLPDNTLLILSVNRPADYGRYSCVASNLYGSDNSTATGKVPLTRESSIFGGGGVGGRRVVSSSILYPSAASDV